jgi:DNA-binding beta-propeller fold protein YncE
MKITSIETEFWCPKGVAVDAAGSVYVGCAVHKGGVQKFVPSGHGAWTSAWSAKAGPVRGVALDGSGNVLATTANGEIKEFTTEGESVGSWGGSGGEQGKFAGPSGIAIAASGEIYVVGSSSWTVRGGGNRVQKFTKDREFLATWGTRGKGDGQFNLPTGIALDRDQNVYVADSYSSRVQVFSPAGAFTAKWGAYGFADGELNCPQGIAVDRSGSVYIADTYNNRVQKFTADGQFIAKWSRCGAATSQFWLPCGIAVDGAGVIYVADTMNHRVQVVEP